MLNSSEPFIVDDVFGGIPPINGPFNSKSFIVGGYNPNIFSPPPVDDLTRLKSDQLYQDVTEDLDPANYINPLFLKATR